MGTMEAEEVERFEEVSIQTSDAARKFHEIVNFLHGRGFSGKPKMFASFGKRFFECEMEKKVSDSFAEIETTVLIRGEDGIGEGRIDVMVSKKSRLTIDFSGPFGEALSSYVSKRVNALKIRRKDREVDEILKFVRGLGD